KESTVACVRKSLVDEMPGVQLVPAAEFREAVRASRWPFGESEEDARRIMADPIVRDAIARVGGRYAIGGSTITTEDKKDALPVGAAWGHRESKMSAHLWDLKEAVVLGTIEVASAGEMVGVGLVPVFFLFTVYSIPLTETMVCRALGRQLAEFLGGEKIS